MEELIAGAGDEPPMRGTVGKTFQESVLRGLRGEILSRGFAGVGELDNPRVD